MDSLITNLILLGLILAFVGAIWFLWLEISRQQRRKRQRGTLVLATKPPSKKSRSTKASDSKLKKQLIKLLHGDREGVERLIKLEQRRQPGKPLKWYEEKVLHDLERDRR